MTTYARVVVRLRFLIVAAWVAAAVSAQLWLPSIQDEQGAPLEGLVANDSSAVQAEIRSAELFDVPVLARTVVVQRDPGGLRRSTEALALSGGVEVSGRRDPRFKQIEFALPLTNSIRLVPDAEETSTTVLTYLFFRPETWLADQKRFAGEYADAYLRGAGDTFVGVTGAVPARFEQFRAIRNAIPLVEIATVALIALIVGLNFRSPLAPVATLFAAGIGYLIATRVITAAGELAGVSVPRELEPLILVLLLGIVTDYAIFFLAGFRQRLSQGEERLDAARAATCDFAPIVATAGMIVAAGTAALVVARLEFFRAFGPGMALTALVGLAVAVTLVPALLAIGGRGLFWPALGRPAGERAGERRRRLPSAVAFLSASRGRAGLVAVLATAVLIAGARGLGETRLGFTLIPGLPRDAEARQAAEAASKGFAPGILSPTVVIVEAPGIVERRRALVRLERALAREPGVAAALGPSLQPRRLAVAVFLSEAGDAVRYLLVLDGDPGGAEAIEIFHSLERAMPRLLASAGLERADVSWAGDTALASDTVQRVVDDLERIAVAAILANLFFLVLFLRSLVAPLYLLGASVLALAASLGVATYFFQNVLGHDEISYYVPFAAAVLLVSLGSDYNILVAGRVWHEARRRPLREAVAVAAPQAARAIAAASLALAASFAVLALVPLRPFREFAFIMALGVLIDSFLVRSLLVPALISLVGEKSAWPARRFRPPRLVETGSERG